MHTYTHTLRLEKRLREQVSAWERTHNDVVNAPLGTRTVTLIITVTLTLILTLTLTQTLTPI